MSHVTPENERTVSADPDDAGKPPNSENRVREILDPSGQTIMTPEQAESVFRRIPLFILADDDPRMLRTVTRILATCREGAYKTLRLQGDMTRCFDSLPKAKDENVLPLILCESGTQAKEATELVRERQIRDGIYIFDNHMGYPFGIEIFKEMAACTDRPRVAQVLFSGSLPDNTPELIKNGTLDGAVEKSLGHFRDFPPQLAQAYLRAQTTK